MRRNLHNSSHSPLWKLRRSLEAKAAIEKNLPVDVQPEPSIHTLACVSVPGGEARESTTNQPVGVSRKGIARNSRGGQNTLSGGVEVEDTHGGGWNSDRGIVHEAVARPIKQGGHNVLSGSNAPPVQLLLIDGLIARCNGAPSLRHHLLRERAELTEPKEAA